LRIWLKIRVFLGWSKFVSACVERDKKNFKKFVFCSHPPAHLRDFQPQISLITKEKSNIKMEKSKMDSCRANQEGARQNGKCELIQQYLRN
jgi:hypothetical protein